MDITPILASFGTAFVTVLLGYFRTTKPEDFSVKKMLATLIIALCVGAGVALFNVPADNVLVYMGEAGLTIWIYWLVDGIYKYATGVNK